MHLLDVSGRSLVLGSALLGALAAAAWLDRAAPSAHAPAIAIASAIAIAPAPPSEVVAGELVDTTDDVAEITDPADFAFALEIDGTGYIRLADDEIDAPRARATIVHEEEIASAIAPVRAKDVPAALRPWKGRRVLVGGTCAARVVGFVEIARVSGEPGYALEGDQGEGAVEWTVETAFEHGRVILAGRLDKLCPGSWARAADRPAAGLAKPILDDKLEAAARAALLASPHAADIGRAWAGAHQPGDWREHVGLDVRIVRHGTTNQRWAFVHAYKPGDCGDHGVNLMVAYELAGDGSLHERHAAPLPGQGLDDLVDLDGDGWFERVIIDFHEDRSLVVATGDRALAALDVPFHGCGC